jgi:multiple sugar transport system substrate-binding protein
MRTALKRWAAVGALSSLAVAGLAGCTPHTPGQSGGKAQTASASELKKALNTPTTLTFWAGVPGIQDEVKLFEKKYPKIKVNVVDVGGASVLYQKLRTALKAGKGAPDLAQIEYQFIPSFRVTNSLVNLAPYGATGLKSKYVGWVWNQVSDATGVYGIPQDSGPMGNLYRQDIFAKAGITKAPATWDEYAKDAALIKAKTGDYISDLPGSDPGQLIGLFWQRGAKPFTYDGKKNLSIKLDSPEAQEVVKYWQGLIQKGYVATSPDFNNDWYKALTTGKYASWPTAAWAPLFLQSAVKSTSGKWRAAPLPQWTAGANVSGNWGGSSDAVITGSKHALAAYAFDVFLNSDPASTNMLATKQFLFPTTNATLTDPSFIGQKSAFYGGQQVNKDFSDISKTVDEKFDWPPVTDYLFSSYTSTLGKAISDKGDLSAGLNAWQKAVVTYAKQQGFTVS